MTGQYRAWPILRHRRCATAEGSRRHTAAQQGDPQLVLDALDAAGRELYFEPLNIPGGGAVAEWRPRDDRPTGSKSHGDLDFLSWRGADRRDHGEDGQLSCVITRVTREIFFDS